MQFGVDAWPVVFAGMAAALGWLVGAAFDSLNDRLLKCDNGCSHAAPALLVRAPLVGGCVATMWGLLVGSSGVSWPTLAAGILAVPLVQVAVTDLRFRSVYSVIAGGGLVLSLVLSPSLHAAGMLSGAAGAAAGFAMVALLRKIGRVGYPAPTMGRGDVTIATMVGAAAGPEAITALAIGVVFSGVLAFAMLVRGGTPGTSIPYGTGLCLGGLVCLVMR